MCPDCIGVNLVKVEVDGFISFECPKCKQRLDPDDVDLEE